MSDYLFVTAGVLVIMGLVYAHDLSIYCGTVTEIYGVCSPELVQNYLDHINAPKVVNPPLGVESVTVATLPGTGQDRQDQNTIVNTPALVEGTPEAQKPVPCWCAIDNSRRCNYDGEIKIVEEYNADCEKRFRRIMGLPEPKPWYADKIYMVS